MAARMSRAGTGGATADAQAFDDKLRGLIMMQIRALTLRDAVAYRELRLRMLREHPDAFTSSFDEDEQKPLSWIERRIVAGTDSPHDFVLGAFGESGELVGTVGLAVDARAKERHKARLFGMYVAQEASTHGVGRALLAQCIERARSIPGLEQVHLTVTSTNGRAVRLYEAAGFRAFGLEERAIKVGDTYYPKTHMTRFLQVADAAEHDAPDVDAVGAKSDAVKQITLAQALAQLAETAMPRSMELFRHGSLLVKWYAPRGSDLQQPHTRDEAYVVGCGSGEFVQGDRRMRIAPGDFLFAAAGVAHRFERFSNDFGVWVFFYGPEGGEVLAHAADVPAESIR